MKVLAFDKYKSNYTTAFPHVEESTPAEILAKADIISFHLPLTDETRQMADISFINKCKRGVIIINTSRGQIVNTKDLIAGLNSGQIGGACLDVFENEKVEHFTKVENQMYDQLYGFDNVYFISSYCRMDY